MATVPKRPLTAEEIADARRLMVAWKDYQEDNPGATQEWLAGITGLGNQTLISQYMTGKIQLNHKALLAICSAIKAKPEKISPTLASTIPQAMQENIASKGNKNNAMTADDVIQLISLYGRLNEAGRERAITMMEGLLSHASAFSGVKSDH